LVGFSKAEPRVKLFKIPQPGGAEIPARRDFFGVLHLAFLADYYKLPGCLN
jgi:hypothetical protein